MHKVLEDEMKFHLKMYNDARIVIDKIEPPVRTIIIHNHHSDSLWLYQSSWSHDEGETEVDMIRLSKKLLKELDINCLKK